MSELLKIVLSLSLSGTLLFIIMLALKRIYKDKFCQTWQYYVWLIVVVRMLLPFTPETTLIGSVFEYLGSTKVETIQTTSHLGLLWEAWDNHTHILNRDTIKGPIFSNLAGI